MGESVFLARSFSQPAQIPSRETKEANPERVLTESVSFGRFKSESLQWAKWSAFTQNRYLEEVERFTRPGSVAEKTAFFEAHFNKRAAAKKTTTTKTTKIVEQVIVNKATEEIVCDEVPKEKDILIDSETKIEHVNVNKATEEIVCDEVQKDILIDSEVSLVVSSTEIDSDAPSTEEDKVESFNVKDVPESEKEIPASGNSDKKVVKIPQKRCRSSIDDKKKITSSSSVDISVKLAFSCAPRQPRNTTTTSPLKSRKRLLPRTSKEAAKCSTTASTVRLPKLPPPKNQLSENNRKNITFGSTIPNNVQGRTRPKSVTVTTPFIFRSDERAEKRKEFFKKLQEKKYDQNTHLASQGHKVSPRFRRNQIRGTENVKKCHESPHKDASVKTKNEPMDKNKRCKIHPSSRSQQTIKKTTENSSPNIRHN